MRSNLFTFINDVVLNREGVTGGRFSDVLLKKREERRC